ncbi:hypothetical protein GPJ56_007556 [Histomonas meleagridis]|uniref:uncharacterized protein n=1 Tax=Histomonas meleagridis TaxID=135588 RepID=UPI00355AA9E3|nr:hypothetical protein GPJ56_007556 [Histomonas meleagridis]KAH0806075.1 hypothetical protein GO595_001088 [Histomonas meleagridis]
MILPEGVTHPKSQKIYLSYDVFAQSLYYNSTEVYFYYENGYVRNATLGFNFTGNWENVEDFELKLLLTNKKDKQFIDVSGIPSNIKYSLEYDDILTFLPKEEEGGGGSGSAGIRMRNITSCALIMVLIATIFAVI